MPENTGRPDHPRILPTGDDYHKMDDHGHRWRVTATSLGGLPEGAVVGVKHFQPGAHLQHLIDSGYLIPLTEHEARIAEQTSPPVLQQPYMQAPAAAPSNPAPPAKPADAKPAAATDKK